VRYLRMLSNSMAAAAIATAYLIALFLQLNPNLPINPARLAPLVSTVGLYYFVHLTAVFYVLLVMRQLLAREVFSPAWISVGVLAWLGALASAAASALMWRNRSAFALVVSDDTALALERSAVSLAAATLLFALVAITRWTAPRARASWTAMFLAVTAASIVVPLSLRGRGSPPVLEARPIDSVFASARAERTPKVTVIAIDAASLDLITRAAAEGRLPNFGRLLDNGAVRHLATLHPTSPEAVWAAVGTGKLPQKNGVRSAAMYRIAGMGGEAVELLPDYCFAHGLERFGFIVEQPHTSATFRTRTLWSIASTNGFTVGVVAWPLTQPAPPVRGYLVSDTYHRVALTAIGLDEQPAIYPLDLQADALSAMEMATSDLAPVVAASIGGAPSTVLDARQETAARTDRIYAAIGDVMARLHPAQVTLTRFQSLDPIGHYFLRYAQPVEFGDVTDEERRRLGTVLERQYGVVDNAIGHAIAGLGADDLLVVVSGYGMEPLAIGKRLIERVIGDPDISGTHEGAPDGFLLAYGAAVAPGRGEARASVVDVVPTILYFLGLPIGRDMDGYARTDLFRKSFTESRPITFIPTYDR
jgi:Type I phosphodiesterase / nucleotide pyrophosphatase